MSLPVKKPSPLHADVERAVGHRVEVLAGRHQRARLEEAHVDRAAGNLLHLFGESDLARPEDGVGARERHAHVHAHALLLSCQRRWCRDNYGRGSQSRDQHAKRHGRPPQWHYRGRTCRLRSRPRCANATPQTGATGSVLDLVDVARIGRLREPRSNPRPTQRAATYRSRTPGVGGRPCSRCSPRSVVDRHAERRDLTAVHVDAAAVQPPAARRHDEPHEAGDVLGLPEARDAELLAVMLDRGRLLEAGLFA